MIFIFMLMVIYFIINMGLIMMATFNVIEKEPYVKRKLDYVFPGYLLGYKLVTWLLSSRT